MNNKLKDTIIDEKTGIEYHLEGDYYMPMAITSIAQQNGCVSFQYQTTAAVVSSDGIIFHEHFSGCAGKGGNDGKWSGNIALAAFKADYEGWSGSKSYGANQCAKFGNTSAHGIAVTPSIYLNGEYELSFLAAPWNNEENFIWLDVESGKATISNHVFDRMKSQQWNEHHTTITGHGWVKLLFYGNNKRFFLDEVMIRKQGGITTDNAGSVPLNSVNNRAGQIIDGKIRDLLIVGIGRIDDRDVISVAAEQDRHYLQCFIVLIPEKLVRSLVELLRSIFITAVESRGAYDSGLSVRIRVRIVGKAVELFL